MLGGTGQGKTAFLNFLANIESATQSIEGIENCKKFNLKSWENKIGGRMASKTNDAQKYEIKIGQGNFTIIDTPGFGDSRGMDYDNQHFQKIKTAVLEEGGINCVCVIQNGREARISPQIRYSYSLLTSILPKAISE